MRRSLPTEIPVPHTPMSGTNLFRLILTLLIALWAFVEVTPSRDTPFDAYVVSQVTDLKGNDGTQVRTQEANLAEFNKLLERAHELVKANQGKPNNPFPLALPRPAACLRDRQHRPGPILRRPLRGRH